MMKIARITVEGDITYVAVEGKPMQVLRSGESIDIEINPKVVSV